MNMNKCVIRKTRKELKKYLPQKKNETEVEKQKRIKRGLYFYEINYKNRIYYVLDVFEYDITHFNPNGNYTYLLKGFTFLNEAITAYHLKEPEIYQRVQKIRMLIKNILTTKDSRKILPRNHKLLKKIIGKLEVFSLSYANNLDDKYTENKTELFYYLIFSIKNIETLYSKNNTAYAETLRNITEIIPFLNRFYKIDAVYAYINRTNLNVSQTNIIGSTPSEKMVEALMLFMNHMTSKIALQEEIPFIYRNHVLEKNHQEELENYLRQIGNQNVSQYYINEINIQKNKYPQSYYSIDNKGHKGLGMSSYAHMTSPIRRLADNYNILMIQECFLKKCSDPQKYHYALLLKQASDIINHQRTTLEKFTRDYYLTRKK